jgi:hypothetical protein
VELAGEDPTYEDMAVKFFEHFLWIAADMDRIGEGHDKLWGARLRQYQACVAALIVGCKLRKQTEVSEDVLARAERYRPLIGNAPHFLRNLCGVPTA